MQTSKSQRLTVSGRNLEFLKQLSHDMDERNLTEVLGYLLTDVRLLNYQIGNKVTPQIQPQQPQQAPIGYAFEPTTFESAFIPTHEQNHIDPTIQRLIDAGLEMEF